ncbi:hypothetical protein EDB80DRAFT_689916 [Ilyonectria destructans]|nr:hypothetical protein EDB80DRAFT_689916 [Ilyonectria destructans]
MDTTKQEASPLSPITGILPNGKTFLPPAKRLSIFGSAMVGTTGRDVPRGPDNSINGVGPRPPPGIAGRKNRANSSPTLRIASSIWTPRIYRAFATSSGLRLRAFLISSRTSETFGLGWMMKMILVSLVVAKLYYSLKNLAASPIGNLLMKKSDKYPQYPNWLLAPTSATDWELCAMTPTYGLELLWRRLDGAPPQLPQLGEGGTVSAAISRARHQTKCNKKTEIRRIRAIDVRGGELDACTETAAENGNEEPEVRWRMH